jgi:hypothetical protein
MKIAFSTRINLTDASDDFQILPSKLFEDNEN